MVHYFLLKLKKDADVTLLYFHCRKVYADLEWELPFLHDAEVSRCATARDSNADIMIRMHIDAPEQLNDFFRHPKHLDWIEEVKDYVSDWMSFDWPEDAKDAC